MGAAFREDATDEEIAAALRDRCFTSGVHRARGGSGLLRRRHDAGRVRELGRPKTPKRVPQRCSLRVGVFKAAKSEPINLPLGYARGTYKAELARRARIYANWGKTT